jgi:hypothetical protein
MVPFEVLTNFKFNLFFKSFIVTDLFSNANVNFNPNATKLTLSPNMIMDLIGFISMGKAFQKGNEKVCEEIVACLFGNLIEPIVNERKKKYFNKSKQEINKVYQNRCVVMFI